MFNIRFNNTNANGKRSHEGEELGTLRPDGAMTFAHIRRSTPDDAAERSTVGSDKMIIRRTTEWDVREDFESIRGKGTNLGDKGRDEEDYEINKASMERENDEAWGERGTHYAG